MKFICKKEAVKGNGQKLMAFTKGVVYDFEKTFDDDWIGLDDNGSEEGFFNLSIMFDPI